MFSESSLGAYLYLQKRAHRQHDSYTIERIDRALDEIVNNPGRTDPVPFQVRSSMANAAKVIKARRVIAPVIPLEAHDAHRSGGTSGDVASVSDASPYAVVETVAWLNGTRLVSPTQRALLLALVRGHDAATLAAASGVPVPRMRERIARARAAARRAYALEVRAPRMSESALLRGPA
jgi:hypothetical protein